MLSSSHSRNNSIRSISNSNGPSTEPGGAPYLISLFILQLLFIHLVSGCLNRKKNKLSDLGVTMYQDSLAISGLWSIKSSALERSVKKAPNYSPLSLDSLNFSSINIRQCWALLPFPNSHCFGERLHLKCSYNCW